MVIIIGEACKKCTKVHNKCKLLKILRRRAVNHFIFAEKKNKSQFQVIIKKI